MDRLPPIVLAAALLSVFALGCATGRAQPAAIEPTYQYWEDPAATARVSAQRDQPRQSPPPVTAEAQPYF